VATYGGGGTGALDLHEVEGIAVPGALWLSILGPVEVLFEGRSLDLGGKRQRAVLAVLVIHVGQTVSFERLADEVWGGRPPRTAATTLRAYVCRLRNALSSVPYEVLETRGCGYALRIAPEELDSCRFQQLVSEARADLAAGRARKADLILADALGLWRGNVLSDLASETFAQAEILRLEELRLSAVELEGEVDLALGRHAEAVGRLKALVATHPLHESFCAQLMVALYRSGRQADALRMYQSLRNTLVEELGIVPSESLRSLERAILMQEAWVAEPAPVLCRLRAA
jgi:DNA-binding SARP family transcriptional activator